jgi:TPR repeat protein
LCWLVPAFVAIASDDADVRLFQVQFALAKKGDAFAQYYLGEMYEQGLGTAQDLSQAFEWYEKSASKGNRMAKMKLAKRHEIEDHEARERAAQAAAASSLEAAVNEEAQRRQAAERQAAAEKEKARKRAAIRTMMLRMKQEHHEVFE